MEVRTDPNPLTGLLFCADCGAVMYNARQPKAFPCRTKSGKVYFHKGADSYTCSTYELTRDTDQKSCTKHFIRTSVVEDLILDAIRGISVYVRDNESEFVDRIRTANSTAVNDNSAALKKLISKNQKRVDELTALYCKAYDDNAAGRLSDKRFALLSEGYEWEQTDLETQNADIRLSLDTIVEDSVKADKFVEIVRRFTAFDELTPKLLCEFIEKVVVHEGHKNGGKRIQQVDISLRFIGKFTYKDI